jgi:hypothetical protein
VTKAEILSNKSMKTSNWAYLGVAALFLLVGMLPSLLTPAPPAQGDLDQEILTQLEKINHHLSQLALGDGLNRPASAIDLASAQTAVRQAQRQPVEAETEQSLRELIDELRRSSKILSDAGSAKATWQSSSIRQNFRGSPSKNLPALQATLTRIGDIEQEFWKEFYFRSLSEILAELGMPDEFYFKNGILQASYADIPYQWQGESKMGDLSLNFMDGICIAGYAG